MDSRGFPTGRSTKIAPPRCEHELPSNEASNSSRYSVRFTGTPSDEMDRYTAPPDPPLDEVSVPARLPKNDRRPSPTCETGAALTLKIPPPLRAALLLKNAASPATVKFEELPER